MSGDYVRLCLTCGAENVPQTMRCVCGALLSGIDLTARPAETAPPPSASAADDSQASLDSEDTAPRLCPHADCAQANPPAARRCVYCDRPLEAGSDGLSDTAAGITSLISLPGTLQARFRIVRALPATGAEAELLIVQALSGGAEAVAKIYRHGIHPNREIGERIARIAPEHRVEVFESGLADGFTFELMEFCRAGSLRDLLARQAPSADGLREIIGELATAISAVHQAGLIHRDLKPENVLVRSSKPLDLVLTDFSIASLHNATLRFTGVARTLAYGAPETLSGVIDQKADWWSLGMMLLEITLGAHPFAGLSDAVILHQLTTRSINLSAVSDADLQKLLHGLLLRDPKNRWGAEEITRWLARDPQLAAAPGEEANLQARQPYRIGDAECFSAEQLAAGLAGHWQQALADLDNGLLMKWLRSELKDQNRVRFLIELNMQRDLHVDVRLLRLIIDLAPGIPPVWRGESLNLRSLLQHVDSALKNDAEAAQWLNALFEYRVLAAYAAAGNPEAADIERRWQNALTQFNNAWETTIAGMRAAAKPAAEAAARYDDVVYGRSEPVRPSPQQIHARLLALTYDPAWTARWRAALAAEVARLSLDCAWLNDLGDIADIPDAGLLTLDSLLPEARKQARRNQERVTAANGEAEAHTKTLQVDSSMVIADIRQAADLTFFDDLVCRGLQEKIDRFSALAAEVRAHARTDQAYLNLRRQVMQLEPLINRLRRLLGNLLERRAINRGWLNQQTLGSLALALFVMPTFISQRWFYPLLLGGGLVAAWRLLPNYFMVREIKALLRKITRY